MIQIRTAVKITGSTLSVKMYSYSDKMSTMVAGILWVCQQIRNKLICFKEMQLQRVQEVQVTESFNQDSTLNATLSCNACVQQLS